MENAEKILKKLKADGCRLTVIRKAVLTALIESAKPLLYKDVEDYLIKNGLSANKTTIYRELSFLKGKNIVTELQFDDRAKRYEIISDTHHHHLICLKCRKVEDVELEQGLIKQERVIAKDKKFKVINHSLEFYGLCHECQTN